MREGLQDEGLLLPLDPQHDQAPVLSDYDLHPDPHHVTQLNS